MYIIVHRLMIQISLNQIFQLVMLYYGKQLIILKKIIITTLKWVGNYILNNFLIELIKDINISFYKSVSVVIIYHCFVGLNTLI